MTLTVGSLLTFIVSGLIIPVRDRVDTRMGWATLAETLATPLFYLLSDHCPIDRHEYHFGTAGTTGRLRVKSDKVFPSIELIERAQLMTHTEQTSETTPSSWAPIARSLIPPAARRSETKNALIFSLVLVPAALCVLISGCNREKETSGNADKPTPASTSHPTWFTEINDEVGFEATYETGASGRLYYPEIMGGGGAFFDFNNDGLLDIYVTSGNAALPRMVSTNDTVNRLYRQEKDGTFTDVTVESGLGDGWYGMGVATGDIDNDGYLDVYLSNYGSDRLYRNRGDGTFEDITDSAGISVGGWSASVAMLDYDRDGFLDIYVTRYGEYNPHKKCANKVGQPDYCGPLTMPALSDVLLHNNGDGTFTDVSQAAGISSIKAAGLGVVCEDMNDDGWIDVYVANDAYANQLWINQHDGTFRDDSLLMGVALNMDGLPEAGMGVIIADLDGDADYDLFMTHLVGETNTFYRNLGGGKGFVDATGECGLGASSRIYTGFGIVPFDAELDGDLDLFIANGRVLRGEQPSSKDLPAPWNLFAESNQLFLNDGKGRFATATVQCDSLCLREEISRAAVAGDIDNDGDLDLLVVNAQSGAKLYRNDAPRQGHWLGVRAVDPELKRDALGSRIEVVAGDRKYVRTVHTGYSYLASHDPRTHFGLGSAQRVSRITVRWPTGEKEIFPATDVDRYITLTRGSGKATP